MKKVHIVVLVVVIGALAQAPSVVAQAETEMVYGRDQMICFVESVQRHTGSEPDRASVEPAVRSLELGRATRSGYAWERVRSMEFRRSVVAELYESMLGRLPDSGGLRHWTSSYTTSAALAADILGSDEYYRSSGSSSGAYVAALFEAVLDRDPRPTTAREWRTALAAGLSRRELARRLWSSEESNARRVDRMYTRLLGRRPDRAGRSHWARHLTTHDDLELAVQLISSSEYVERCGTERAKSARRPVLIIGDSLTVGPTRAGLNADDLARGWTVDALDGRRIRDGTRILSQSDLAGVEHIVFALGSNDFRRPDAELVDLIDRALASAAGRRTTWVNVDSGSTYLAGATRFNQLLAAAELRHPNLAVADWDRFISSRRDRATLRHDDGVHYSDQGNRVRALWLADLVSA